MPGFKAGIQWANRGGTGRNAMSGKAEITIDRHWSHAAPHVGTLTPPASRPYALGPWETRLKRGQDVVGAVFAVCLFAVPMLLVALAIRLDSPGPVLFRQRRTGLGNRDFTLLKFRTMKHAACNHLGGAQARRDDPRLTRLGAFLRRSSLDELPQLFNVLRGDMALVGPRPHAPETRAGGRLFADVMPGYADRHVVKPGITGLAQIRGLRGETRTEEALIRRVEADFEYISRRSLGLDLLILLRTAWCVLRMKNAY